MGAQSDSLKTELIDRVGRMIAERLGPDDAAAADAFMRAFFRNVPPADIAPLSRENLYGMAMSFWRHAQGERPEGTARLRVFNPREETHGWKSSHTVAEIVNDDMPFLVDSIAAALNGRGLTVHLVIHPTMRVRRGGDRTIVGGPAAAPGRPPARPVDGADPGPDRGPDRGADPGPEPDTGDKAGADPGPDRGAGDGATESLIHIQMDEVTDPAVLADLAQGLQSVLCDVRAAVGDWQAMLAAMREAGAAMEANAPALARGEVAEAAAFIAWAAADRFTILGYRQYDYGGRGAVRRLRVAPGGLGILRDPERRVFENWRAGKKLPPEINALAADRRPVWITKANDKSPVHRNVHMDVIGIRHYDTDGRVAGERLVLGLFTSAAYSLGPTSIPLLRHKIAAAKQRSGFAPGSHDDKALAHILATYPRDELFQIGETQLYVHAIGILNLQERQRIALFMRRDPFDRFVTALVYIPRDRYNTGRRRRFIGILERALGGRVVAFTPKLSPDSTLAQVLFIVKTTPGAIPAYDPGDIQAALTESARSWADKLRDALVEAQGEETGLRLDRRYAGAFSPGYRERYTPGGGVFDIGMIERVLESGHLGMHLHRPLEGRKNDIRLKLYHAGGPMPLSDILPTLENMGLKVISEEPFEVRIGADRVWVHDYEAISRVGPVPDVAAVRDTFQTALARVVAGEAEDDAFNTLVLAAGLDWRQVVMLRAACKFLLQARVPFSQAYMARTLAANIPLTRLILELFARRLGPGGATADTGRLRGQIRAALDRVANLDQDRILRHFANFVTSTLRTNFFQTAADGGPKPHVSFKLDSRAIDDLPEPRPMTEIFVYSPRMEGCHLRGGSVARGGIRWSDRQEDFRTEVLGLAKAQRVKNAVIVPVGAKGGFVCKRPPEGGDRQALTAEAVACYRILIAGMLDVTDNLAGGAVVPPEDVVRHDGDDPYLVVAADKGTATFSDIANEISLARGFWLGDAFASGGSAGYDHKAMGITARGAWESVKRHFREQDRDIQAEPFTVIGVGDMSGDVFGNGMLLSPHIRLVCAFNHLHVFVDPDPVPAVGLAERQRLFALPRSGWSDYDPKLISKGGGVFDRKAKSIPVSPEMQRLLDIRADTLTPNRLIRAILAAPADLLWFGGIGTYVKARSEGHAEVSDRTNDAVRINAEDLRVRVVGEGANLGITQRGRVAFAARGGLINTDFIDNAAGVDASDHEVNIKIVLDAVVAAGDMTGKQRDRLLRDMTGDVARMVLNDNYLQGQAIAFAAVRAPELLDAHWQTMRAMERAGRLDRGLEYLPDDEAVADRRAARAGLTRPEYAVLFSHAKLALYEDILPGDLPDDPFLLRDLARYFPPRLREAFAGPIARHRLRREIVATYITNSLVNRTGAAFIHTLQSRTGRSPVEIARAYVIARDILDLRPVWRAIEALDNRVTPGVQAQMARSAERLVARSTVWLLRRPDWPLDITATIDRFAAGVRGLADIAADIVTDAQRAALADRVAALRAGGVPADLADRIGAMDLLAPACDIVAAAAGAGVPVAEAGRTYFSLGARLGLDWLRHAARAIRIETNWQQMAVDAMIDDAFAHQTSITAAVLGGAGDPAAGSVGAGGAAGKAGPDGAPDPEGKIDLWIAARAGAVARSAALLDDLRNSATDIDLAILMVANRELRALAGA